MCPLLAHATSEQEAKILKEYPNATKATFILDYLFVEDANGKVIDQCYISKEDNTKNCYMSKKTSSLHSEEDNFSKPVQTPSQGKQTQLLPQFQL